MAQSPWKHAARSPSSTAMRPGAYAQKKLEIQGRSESALHMSESERVLGSGATQRSPVKSASALHLSQSERVLGSGATPKSLKGARTPQSSESALHMSGSERFLGSGATPKSPGKSAQTLQSSGSALHMSGSERFLGSGTTLWHPIKSAQTPDSSESALHMSGSEQVLRLQNKGTLQTLQKSSSALAFGSPQNVHARDNHIRVYVRVRPPNNREREPTYKQIVTVDPVCRALCLEGGGQMKTYIFDGVLGMEATQEDTFNLVDDVSTDCLVGLNSSICVYGQTGTGKTHTMFGPATTARTMQCDEQRGLVGRIFECVFAEVDKMPEADGVSYSFSCSFLEIYKEQISDLLEPQNANLHIRENSGHGVYVDDLSEPRVWSLTDSVQVLWKGLQNRHVGSTHMNERSSRSHAVFTLSVVKAHTKSGVTSTSASCLRLVDLAGSERQQSFTNSGACPSHQSALAKEAGAINKSLSALTNVIMALSKSTVGEHCAARYRESKLTFLLRDSIGGNSKTVLVANVSPSARCYGETLSTLQFASRAKHIQCSAVRNEEVRGTLSSLSEEVKLLRQRLAHLEEKPPTPCFQEMFIDSSTASVDSDSMSESIHNVEPDVESVCHRDSTAITSKTVDDVMVCSRAFNKPIDSTKLLEEPLLYDSSSILNRPIDSMKLLKEPLLPDAGIGTHCQLPAPQVPCPPTAQVGLAARVVVLVLLSTMLLMTLILGPGASVFGKTKISARSHSPAATKVEKARPHPPAQQGTPSLRHGPTSSEHKPEVKPQKDEKTAEERQIFEDAVRAAGLVCHQKTCGAGSCNQRNCVKPTCSGGGCKQLNTFGAECSAGHCDQRKSFMATCSGGNCAQHGAAQASCTGGGCKKS